MTEESPGQNALTEAERRFAERVATLRKDKGWTQSELAERMSRFDLPYVTQSTVSRIEKKTRPVRMIEAQAISRIFDRPVALLINTGELGSVLESAEQTHMDGRREYVQFRRATLAVLEAQQRLRSTLEDLERLQDERDGLEPAVRDEYDLLLHNIRNFLSYDFATEVSEFAEQVKREGIAQSESRAAAFMGSIRKPRPTFRRVENASD